MPWSDMWAKWNWPGWVKWQIDQLNALGGNCVRLIGGVSGITDHKYSLDQYLGRWKQFLDYTASLGMFAYPCGGGLGHWSTTTDSQAQDIYAAWGALLDTYEHVIGVDATNEAYGEGVVHAGRSHDSVMATLAAITEALRDNLEKPITHSQVLMDASWWGAEHTADLVPLCDFYDFHLYYTPINPLADAEAFLKTAWGRTAQIVIGEVGENLLASSAARAARYSAVQILTEASGQFQGALAWAITDTVPDSAADAFGLVDRAGLPRTDVATAFGEWPTSRQ
jgi:hypothetical protein